MNWGFIVLENSIDKIYVFTDEAFGDYFAVMSIIKSINMRSSSPQPQNLKHLVRILHNEF